MRLIEITEQAMHQSISQNSDYERVDKSDVQSVHEWGHTIHPIDRSIDPPFHPPFHPSINRSDHPCIHRLFNSHPTHCCDHCGNGPAGRPAGWGAGGCGEWRAEGRKMVPGAMPVFQD